MPGRGPTGRGKKIPHAGGGTRGRGEGISHRRSGTLPDMLCATVAAAQMLFPTMKPVQGAVELKEEVFYTQPCSGTPASGRLARGGGRKSFSSGSRLFREGFGAAEGIVFLGGASSENTVVQTCPGGKAGGACRIFFHGSVPFRLC